MNRAMVIAVFAAGLALACGDQGPGGEPGTIAGTVWAPSIEGDSVPLAGANVLVTRTFCGFGALCAIAAQSLTDSVGHYRLAVPADQYTAVVNPPPDLALQSQSQAIEVKAGEATTLSFFLPRSR